MRDYDGSKPAIIVDEDEHRRQDKVIKDSWREAATELVLRMLELQKDDQKRARISDESHILKNSSDKSYKRTKSTSDAGNNRSLWLTGKNKLEMTHERIDEEQGDSIRQSPTDLWPVRLMTQIPVPAVGQC